MKQQIRLGSAYISILSILIHSLASYSSSESVKDPFRAGIGNELAIEQEGDFDQISIKDEAGQEFDKHVRVKRHSPSKVDFKSETTKKNEKRTILKKNIGKISTNPEAEDGSLVPGNKDTEYNGGNLVGVEDTDRFIDQDERSSFYDDFEVKDVVKRGVSGAEDYEEFEEKEVPDSADGASIQEVADDEIGKGKIREDGRIKREPNDKSEVHGSVDRSEASEKYNSLKEGKTEVKETSTKRDVKSEKQERVASKVEKDPKDRTSDLEEQEVEGDKKEEESKLSNDQKVFPEIPNPVAVSKLEDPKLEDPKLEDSKIEDSKIEDAKLEDSKLEDSKMADVSNRDAKIDGSSIKNAENLSKADVAGDDYEKRVEEEIQRKIDLIKEDIKREIEQKQRTREIEENNAKFDELSNEGDEDEGQNFAAEKQNEKPQSLSKRSATESHRLRDRQKVEKRRKKRQDEMDPEKIHDSCKLNGNIHRREGRSIGTGPRKRSASRYEGSSEVAAKISSKMVPMKKREYARQVFLVKGNDRGGRRKRRRRRSKNFVLVPEQASVKIDENLPAELSVDSNLRRVLGNGKPAFVAIDGDKNEAPQEKKSDFTDSLAGNSEELSPRLAEYREAFGGLQGESGTSLARFKRIKRVLRTPVSRN